MLRMSVYTAVIISISRKVDIKNNDVGILFTWAEQTNTGLLSQLDASVNANKEYNIGSFKMGVIIYKVVANRFRKTSTSIY